ncbi:hypothetical protein BDF14DRAFT_1717576 [Spinellus fusiger]|nr:hypothetical protein BDF14DRAFT_1717576 [Spinellus fusiger]
MSRFLRRWGWVPVLAGVVGSQWPHTPSHALIPTAFTPLTVIEKEQVTRDTFRLRVQLDKEQKSFPILSSVHIKDNTMQVMRSYTPINPNPYKDGYMDLLIKRYEDGCISRTLSATAPQDAVFVRGPIVDYHYTPRPRLGLIAGGTGITPMYQLVQHILQDTTSTTQVWLIYASATSDILLKKEIDQLAADHKHRFNVVYVVEHPSPDWPGLRGRINEAIMAPLWKAEDHVVVCGPPGMMASVCGEKARHDHQGPVQGILGQWGASPDRVWKLQ